jgi:predicted enzyme related to lactoylglutathione lyase
MPRSKKSSVARPRSALIPVRALDFVMYSAKDLRKTRAFYQKLFGFKKGEEWNDSWSEFATEPLTLCLDGKSKKPPTEGEWNGPPCVALAVEDVPKAVALCRKQRVKVLFGPIETRVCWMAWIADPDGNPLCLHSRKNGTAG